jgi:hypothetical protein
MCFDIDLEVIRRKTKKEKWFMGGRTRFLLFEFYFTQLSF